MDFYLRSTDIIDWKTQSIKDHARLLAGDVSSSHDIVRICFEWVRDNISHSGDSKAPVTTCSASEVLENRTGWCFAKSHLLAALLRANDIPTGFCYQRLCRDDGNGFSLHGLNAAYLPGIGWYRIDSRGNKPGVNAQFCPPDEKLAFLPQAEGEYDFTEIWPDPVGIVIECLQKNKGWEKVRENLPDIQLIKRPQNLSLNSDG
jgi:transglutaminase-like putative cysteine protease